LLFEDLQKAHRDWIESVTHKTVEVPEASKRHNVKIIWGSDSGNSKPCSYSFNTEAELEAFLLGVDESNGWMDYEVLEADDHASL
jgi:hypothetical protein